MAGTTGNLFSGGVTKFGIGWGVTTDLGFTKGGVKISRDVTWLDFEVDQFRATMKKQVVKNEMKITTTLAEGALKALQVGWGMPTTALLSNSSYLNLVETDGNASNNMELDIYFEGPGPSGKTRVYNFYRSVAMGTTEYNISRGEESNVPVEFHILYDNSQTPAKFGEMWDKP